MNDTMNETASDQTNGDASRLEHEIGERGRFQLRLPAGDVAIRGVDGTVARVVDTDRRVLDDQFRIERGEGRLSLTTRDGSILDVVFSGARGRGTAHLAIELPRAATVSVETASADVEATDLTGVESYRTASGEVALERVAGSIDVVTVSGDVDLDGSGTIALRAQTVSGDVDLRAPAFGRLDLATTSGDMRIDARLAGGGPFAIQTVSGDAEIVGRSGLAIEAKTITGDLDTELPHRAEARPGRKSLIVGGGETRLSFQSVSGDLKVTRPRDELPPTPTPVVAAPDAAAPSTVPSGDASVAPTGGPGGASLEERRLALLRSLESGDLTVDEAMARLAALEEG